MYYNLSMKMLILFIIVSLTFLSCTKSISNESQNIVNETIKNNDSVIVNSTITEHKKYEYDFYKVILSNKNIILKENSLNRNYAGIDHDANYDIVFVNTNNNTNATIVSDKFFKTRVLPVVYNQTRQNEGGDDTIKTMWSKCFVLQILENNNYKLIYIDDINNDMKVKEYKYRNSYFPSHITITITPSYFIVWHDEIDGEEYILINQYTGEYKIIDTQEKEGH